MDDKKHTTQQQPSSDPTANKPETATLEGSTEQATSETKTRAEYFDPLLHCLEIICRIEHHHFSSETATAGLPLINNTLTPSLFVRAARRLGFAAKVIERPLTNISHLTLPAVLIMKNNDAYVLKAIHDNDVLEIIDPETGGDSLHTLDELESEYAGYVIFVQPDYRFDERADQYNVIKEDSWLWSTLWHYRSAYVQVLVAAFLINCFALVSPLFIMNVYDRVVPNNAVETLWMLAIGVSVIYLFDFFIRVVRGYLIDKVGKKADILLSSTLFERVMGLRLSEKPNSAGAFASNLRDFESLRDTFTSSTLTLLIDIPFIVLFAWVLWYIAGPIALIPLLALPVVVLAAILIEIPLQKAVQQSILGSTQKQAVIVEAVSNLPVLKSLSAEGVMQKRWEQYATITAQAALKSRFFSALAVNITVYVQQMVTVLIVLAGVYAIHDGNLSMGGLIACTLLAGRILAPLSQIANLVSRLQQAILSYKGLSKLIKAPQERPHGRKFLQRKNIKGSIEFDEVGFHYPHQPVSVLNKVSFSINTGERVGIIGRVGSGKSTILQLCQHFHGATEGTVKIDGIDIGQLDPANLRHHIGFVPEHSQLFYGTVRDNILIGNPTADHETLISAAKIAGIDPYLKQHPLGYDLVIGEGGDGLSNGQRQAVCIARALVRNPKVLLFDEPTSHMDSSGESHIIEQLKEKFLDTTMVLVTHKVSLLALVDRVMVVENGQIIMDGPRDKVLATLMTNTQRQQNVG